MSERRYWGPPMVMGRKVTRELYGRSKVGNSTNAKGGEEESYEKTRLISKRRLGDRTGEGGVRRYRKW